MTRHLWILMLVLLLTGCGGGGGSSAGATSSGASASDGASQQPTVAVTSSPAVFTAPSPATPTTAQVTLRFTLSPNAVPGRIDSYRITGLDSAGSVVFGPETDARSGEITLTLPLTTKTLRIEYLHAGTVEGLSTLTLDLKPGGTVTITDPGVTVPTAEPVSLTASPDTSLPNGTTTPLTARAEMADGSMLDVTSVVTWSTSDASVATVSNAAGSRGLVTARQPGGAAITAKIGALTAICNVTVTAATIETMQVTPLNGTMRATLTQQMTATGLFTDGTSHDLTRQATWHSSDSGVATVDATGLLTGVTAGTASVSASFGGVDGQVAITVNQAPLVDVQVTPATPSLAKGTILQLVAIATFADGSTQDVTSAATWSSTDSQAAPVSNAAGSVGRVTGLRVGTSDVSAAFGGMGQTRTLKVTNATLDAISVTPLNPAIAISGTQTFVATGLFSDGTTQDVTLLATWASSGASATMSAAVATGAQAGQTQISATIGAVSGQTALTVTDAPLASIDVTPAAPTIPLKTGLRFRAVGHYADATSVDLTSQVTWQSSSASLTVSNAAGTQGQAFAASPSQASIDVSATLGGVAGHATVSIDVAKLQRVDVTPTDPIVAKGTTRGFTATGIYSDGTTADLTSSASWVSSNTAVVTMSGATATSVVQGQVLVQATVNGVLGKTTLTVTDASLSSISVSPSGSTLPIGLQTQFTATGTYSDNSTQDLTSQVAWTSSTGAASISSASGSQGLALALSTSGSPTTITATLGAVSGSTSLTVSAAVLQRIDVTPQVPAIAKGTTQTFAAQGQFSDGISSDVTNLVSWSSSDTSKVTVSGKVATGQAVGSADVTATLSGVSGKSRLTVTSATLSSIAVTPPSPTAAKGTTLQFVATGTYSDNSTQDLSSLVTWSSSTGAATVSNAAGSRGLAAAISAGGPVITATLGAVSGSTALTVSAASLVRIDVAPPAPAIAKGTTQAFTATGVYSDNTTADLTSSVSWSTTDPTVATMPSNTATGLAAGSCTVRAAQSGVTGTAHLDVTDATLMSIALTPSAPSLARGTSTTLTATGTFSDGSTQDLSSSVSWSSDNSVHVTVDARGKVSAIALGSAGVSATLDGVSATTTVTTTAAVLTALQIQPQNPLLIPGIASTATVIGRFSDQTTQDLTSTATWSTADTAVCTVSNVTKGQLSPLKAGQTSLTATVGAVSNTTAVTVRSAQITQLTVSPSSVASLPLATTARLACTATLTDGTTVDVTSQATWSSTSGHVSVSNAAGSQGKVTALSLGPADLTAALLGFTSNACTVTATSATLQSIAVTPTAPNIASGTTQQFTATGTYSDGTTGNLTATASWSSSSSGVATDDANGLATAVAQGQTTITATVGAVSGTTNLAVHSSSLSSIAVTPGTPIISNGFTQQFVATGTYADGSTQDLSSQVTWASSSMIVAMISNAAGSRGLATSMSAGGTTISATMGGVSGTTLLTVSAATLKSIAVTPVLPSIIKATTQAFTATATFSDGSTSDITSSSSWVSSNNGIATMSSNVATGQGVGVATITATKNGVQGTSNLNVRAATLLSIVVTPDPANVNQASRKQMSATGTYSDGTTLDITSLVTWFSSVTGVATISNANDLKGQAQGVQRGTSNITATFGGVTSNAAVLNVLAAITQVLTDGNLQPLGGPTTAGDLSANGSRVAEVSDATNLISGDTNGLSDVFVADTGLGSVTRVSLVSGTTQVTTGAPQNVSISDDGTTIVYDTTTQLDPTNDTNSQRDLYLSTVTVSGGKLVPVGAPKLVSRVGLNGAVSGGSGATGTAISLDKNLIAFSTTASNLAGTTNGWRQVVYKNMTTGTITSASVVDGAGGANLNNANATQPAISRNGRYVGFCVQYFPVAGGPQNIEPGYTTVDGEHNQYVRDSVTNKTFRIAKPGLVGTDGGRTTSFSDDGKVIAFDSGWSDLVPGDTNGVNDIFVYTWDGSDPTTGVIERVSVQDTTGGECNGDCSFPWISGDGRYVVYQSMATNLDPLNADTNAAMDIFIYDRTTRKTRRVSVDANGNQGAGSSQGARISRDGTFILFQTTAPLSPLDTNGQYDFYIVPNPLQ